MRLAFVKRSPASNGDAKFSLPADEVDPCRRVTPPMLFQEGLFITRCDDGHETIYPHPIPLPYQAPSSGNNPSRRSRINMSSEGNPDVIQRQSNASVPSGYIWKQRKIR